MPNALAPSTRPHPPQPQDNPAARAGGGRRGAGARRRASAGPLPTPPARSTSPYLLQYQDNPVDWLEWGDAAFELARERDVPVLLSVGYAACHRRPVLAHAP